MKLYKITLSIIILIFLQGIFTKAFCEKTGEQIFSAELSPVLTVENIYLDGIPCLKGDTLSDVKVLSITQAAPDNLIYKLSSLAVQIHSNIDIPINVSVDFYDLTEIDNNYKFNKKDLLISPSSCTISKPHDHILSDYFTPYINVSPNVIKGTYIGTFIITLGAL